MSKKIYLSPSNQDGNLYAYGNTNECDQCNRIADAAKAPSTATKTNASKTIYRIQVGAYSDKKNAENFLKKVKAAGFTNAIIVTSK